MVQTATDTIPPRSAKQSHPVLLAFGLPLILVTALLAWRTIWEETSLSLERGPQMVGFALAHGPFAISLLAPVLLMLWLIPALIAVAYALWQKTPLSGLFWTTLLLAIAAVCLLSLPPAFWQFVLIERFAKSPQAVEFMTEDAAQGYRRTVAAYLDQGIPVDARGRYGTAANAAAVGGSVEVLKLLQSRGANLNAVDSTGDSPLSNAIETNHTAAASYLRSQGALEIKPAQSPQTPADVTVTAKPL